MTHVKICGCMRVEDALAAKEAGADFVGLVFAPGSRRRLAIEEARAIVNALGEPVQAQWPPADCAESDVVASFRRGAEQLEAMLARKRPLAVGVFEDQPMGAINAIAEQCGLDLIQLSGHEPWSDCRLANRPVIKAIEAQADTAAVDGLEAESAIACLLDVSRGRGVAYDRAMAADVARRLPVWLAGGLTPASVSNAVRQVRPWAVDVSSGVETDGAKDAAKIAAFVMAAKGRS